MSSSCKVSRGDPDNKEDTRSSSIFTSDKLNEEVDVCKTPVTVCVRACTCVCV